MIEGGKAKNVAYIVAVNMGYGHERPAHALREFAVDKKIIVANDYPGIPDQDRKLWETGRTWYERISRFKKVPIIGRAAFKLMDDMQRIEAFYPRRDLSRPSFQLREAYYLIRKLNHMRHLIEKLAAKPKPILATYSLPAFAAEEYGYPEEIFCLCTDADVSRAWAPIESKKTRIRYFAPNGRVAERLMLYGVPEKNIELTGFPFPTSLIGGIEAQNVLIDLKRRICTLDPKNIFVAHTGKALADTFGSEYCESAKKSKSETITVAFAVGGAGAQRDVAMVVAKSLRREIRAGKINLHLIAGTRSDVEKYFREELAEIGLRNEIKKGSVSILFEKNRQAYFDNFTRLMRKIDILWTKPSELSFYTGLGIPIIMAPAVGSQEDYNHKWLGQVGGGIDQLDPRYTNEWLFDWVASGSLARMAWNGFVEAPTHGTYRIIDLLLGRPNTIHELPLVV